MLQKNAAMTSKNEEARDDLTFHFPNKIIYASARYSLIDMFLPKLPYFKKGYKFHNLLKNYLLPYYHAPRGLCG